ncbi:hypothetical protein [Streptosporangium lutulentum]|uniref:Uncharacterized protein n=1 Tax=Streptosporangium lutulentum TaxID=1461250 RepID=A0ABT9QU08_9ACTN|nr:hypothetical protein [Streptosporangium lutulentum]MDP9850241.1 hypothetical protein [Streptosporangium lutulentum]
MTKPTTARSSFVDTSHDDALPVLLVRDGITYIDNERLLVDGHPVAPGRYRLQLGDAADLN